MLKGASFGTFRFLKPSVDLNSNFSNNIGCIDVDSGNNLLTNQESHNQLALLSVVLDFVLDQAVSMCCIFCNLAF